MKNKNGFTLLEVLLALALFATASVVIFSIFISNNNSIEIQGRETFLHEEIDRGIQRLSDRVRGTADVSDVKSDDTLMEFQYYFRDNEDLYDGRLYKSIDDKGNLQLRLTSKKNGIEEDILIMDNLKDLDVQILDENGNEAEAQHARALKLKYSLAVSYRKIQRVKSGTTVIKFRNILE